MQTFRSACHGRPKGLHCTLVLAGLLFSSPAAAHHSAAATYDAGRTVTVTGTVSQFLWRNPHCFLYLDVETGPYKNRRYVVEMSSLGVLSSAGWTKLTVKAGDTVSVTVMPSRNGTAAGLCRTCDMRINGRVTKAYLVQ